MRPAGDALLDTVVRAIEGTDTPPAALRAGMHAFFAFIDADRDAWRVLFDATLPAGGEVARGVLEYRARLDELVRALLAQMPGDLTRESVLGSRLSAETPAYDVQQACGTGRLPVLAYVTEAQTAAVDHVDRGDAPLGAIGPDRLNVNGGSLAAGHPFAATGGRIVGGLAKALHERGSGRGVISICAAGGQGVVAVLEKPGA